MNVLIVDENPIILKLLAAEAEKCGFPQITTCSTASEAIHIFEKERPGFVVLNWKLDGDDGVELCTRMRLSDYGKYCVIVMIMEPDNLEKMEAAIKAGVDHFLFMPVRQKVLEAWFNVAQQKQQELQEIQERDKKKEEQNQEMEDLQDQLEEALSRANKMAMEAELAYIELNQIFRTVAGGIVLIDRDCNILRHNEAFQQMIGIPEGETLTKKCFETFHSCLCKSPECPLTRITAGEERIENEIEKKYEDGTVIYYHIVSTPFRGPGGDLLGMVEYIMDISEMVKAKQALEESEKRYKELSIVDELTGLFNKRYFNQNLQREIERAERYGHPLALIMMDIDNFKHHNDTYGHADGDKVLEKLGGVIAESVRANDVACRYGGEEFAVILPETSGEDAIVVAERIRTSFFGVDFYPNPDEKVNKSLSLGIAQFAKGDNKINLIERADENLYEAKKQGKNRCVY
jgi:two-component system cell cycle response regulator